MTILRWITKARFTYLDMAVWGSCAIAASQGRYIQAGVILLVGILTGVALEICCRAKAGEPR